MNKIPDYFTGSASYFTKFLHTLTSKYIGRAGLLTLLSFACFTFSGESNAGPIIIPDGDFSSVTNANAASPIGGGLLTPAAQNVTIGTSGPWTGSYAGAIGVVAPPTLSIDSTAKQANIGGILGLNVAGSLVANSGSFNQVLATGDPANLFRANKVYTLSVNVAAPTIVGVNLLSNSIIGSAFTSTSGATTTTLSSTTGSPATLTLISTGNYKLSLPYTTLATGNPIGGQIGVSLFSKPSGLASLNLLPTISFSNVTLNRVGTVPSSIIVTVGSNSGTQTAVVGQPFAHPLSVTVVDSDGDAVPGVPVTFTVPGSGAGAAVAPGGSVVTGADGTATVNATANTLPGGYVITAQVGGVTTPAIFNLTNVAGPPFAVTVLPPSPTSATVATSFAPLLVAVTDQYGNPVADGITVTVTATTGATGASTQALTMTTTTSGGQAQITESANNVAGSYTITATAGAASSGPIALTNAPGVPIKVVPGAGSAAASGTPQSATVTKAFSTPLSVMVTDQFGNPVSGAVVSFTLPPSGASATLSANPVTTDVNGIATITATANNLTGVYQIVANVVNGTQSTTFTLTNTGATTGIAGGTPQVTVVSTEFGCALIAKVTDANGPVSGVGVQFIATPAASGASATFSTLQGAQNSNPLSITTDSSGAAAAVATGNNISGNYTVTAGIPGTGQVVTFLLSNLAEGERLFFNGFEDPLSTCPVASQVTP